MSKWLPTAASRTYNQQRSYDHFGVVRLALPLLTSWCLSTPFSLKPLPKVPPFGQIYEHIKIVDCSEMRWNQHCQEPRHHGCVHP